jgi:hypothetical protein
MYELGLDTWKGLTNLVDTGIAKNWKKKNKNIYQNEVQNIIIHIYI